MKEIRNISARPLKIALPGGKVLRVGPNKVGQIADSALEHATIVKLIADGTIEVVEGGTVGTQIRSSGGGKRQGQQNMKSFRRGSGDR